jgi:DNA-binding MarR family transcriptional regulator
MEEIEIGDTTSRVMMHLSEEQKYATQIAECIDRDRSTVSKHLSKLEDRGLARRTAESNPIFYELTTEGYQLLIRWLKHNKGKQNMVFRHHKITVKIPIRRGQEKVAQEEREKMVEMKNWSKLESDIETEMFGKIFYTLNHENLTVRIPEAYYPATREGLANALLDAYNKAFLVKKNLESNYGKLEMGIPSDVSLPDQHLALENEPFSKILSNIGIDGVLESGEGYLLNVDESKGKPEMEFEGSHAHAKAETFLENVIFLTKNRLQKLVDRGSPRPN